MWRKAGIIFVANMLVVHAASLDASAGKVLPGQKGLKKTVKTTYEWTEQNGSWKRQLSATKTYVDGRIVDPNVPSAPRFKSRVIGFARPSSKGPRDLVDTAYGTPFMQVFINNNEDGTTRILRRWTGNALWVEHETIYGKKPGGKKPRPVTRKVVRGSKAAIASLKSYGVKLFD